MLNNFFKDNLDVKFPNGQMKFWSDVRFTFCLKKNNIIFQNSLLFRVYNDKINFPGIIYQDISTDIGNL